MVMRTPQETFPARAVLLYRANPATADGRSNEKGKKSVEGITKSFAPLYAWVDKAWPMQNAVAASRSNI